MLLLGLAPLIFVIRNVKFILLSGFYMLVDIFLVEVNVLEGPRIDDVDLFIPIHPTIELVSGFK